MKGQCITMVIYDGHQAACNDPSQPWPSLMRPIHRRARGWLMSANTYPRPLQGIRDGRPAAKGRAGRAWV